MGKGNILAVSTKQKCVSKPSTEAELIAVRDLIGQATNLKRVAEEIIGVEIKLFIYQDNESKIKLMKSGTVGVELEFELRIRTRKSVLKERSSESCQIQEN